MRILSTYIFFEVVKNDLFGIALYLVPQSSEVFIVGVDLEQLQLILNLLPYSILLM